jgi:hypothetical protein
MSEIPNKKWKKKKKIHNAKKKKETLEVFTGVRATPQDVR